MTTVNVLLFDDFTAMDAIGPAEVLGRLADTYAVRFVSREGGLVAGTAGLRVATDRLEEPGAADLLLVPGGYGTRKLAEDRDYLRYLKTLAEMSRTVLCVCTGSALLAATGLLAGRRATSNKLAWEWVIARSAEVDWVRRARWVADGAYWTSSGVTAGIDMALAFVADAHGAEAARKVAASLEYVRRAEADDDPFA